MDKKLEFKIFCLESYKQAHNLTGKEVYKIFETYKVLDYLDDYYDVLHSTGQKYIVEDIEKYLQAI